MYGGCWHIQNGKNMFCCSNTNPIINSCFFSQRMFNIKWMASVWHVLIQIKNVKFKITRIITFWMFSMCGYMHVFIFYSKTLLEGNPGMLDDAILTVAFQCGSVFSRTTSPCGCCTCHVDGLPWPVDLKLNNQEAGTLPNKSVHFAC